MYPYLGLLVLALLLWVKRMFSNEADSCNCQVFKTFPGGANDNTAAVLTTGPQEKGQRGVTQDMVHYAENQVAKVSKGAIMPK